MKTWKELPLGGIIKDVGNTKDYITGTWRTERPVFLEDKCTQCFMCCIVCPDSAVIIKDENVVGFNYDHCKGCGICAVECLSKPKAIEMEKEEQF